MPTMVAWSKRHLSDTPKRYRLHAGENLKSLKTSGVYYVHVKRLGKQFRRAWKPGDQALARRRLADFMRDLERLKPTEATNLTFEQVAARWMELTRHTIKESSPERRQRCIKAVSPYFFGLSSCGRNGHG